ncbi:MAG: hypothetical protein KTR32_14155 [Granulosicoccus sp.]|nr:hypothetical protein [Granulosicoccus sp.]
MPTLKFAAYNDTLLTPQHLTYIQDKIAVAESGANQLAILDELAENRINTIGAGALTNVVGVAAHGTSVVAVHNYFLREYDSSGVLSATQPIAASQAQGVTYVPPLDETVIADFANDQLLCFNSVYNQYSSLGVGPAPPISSPGPDRFNQPKDVHYAEDQQVGPALFVADQGYNRVLRIRLDTKTPVGKMALDFATNTDEFKHSTSPSSFRPSSVAYDPDRELLYCTSGFANLWVVDIRSGSVDVLYDNPGSDPDQFINTAGIALSSSGIVAVSDYTLNKVATFKIS